MADKTKKSFILLFSLLLLGSTLAGCGGNKTPSESSEPASQEESSEPVESETSEQESSEQESSESSEEDVFIDYAHNGSCMLTLDYKGRDFMVDGIGEVTLKTAIDGDTAHFYPTVGHTTTVLKARFYGIDTPESTGSVQPFGKKASNFTKEKLKNAAENGTIVVSSPFDEYKAPSHDSTGDRFLSLVWINETKKNCDYDELILLNLWIVQEGYSWARNVNDYPRLADIFQEAQAQAERFVLNLWTGYDEDFNDGDYETTSLLEIKREIALSIADSSHVNKFDNKKVRFTGAVSGYADRTLYVQDYCYNYLEDGSVDPDNPGEYAGINVFVGMGKVPDKYLEVGAYLEIVGLALDNENFGFQISDTTGHWASAESGVNDCKVILSAEDNTEEHALHVFEYSAAELDAVAKNNNLESLYCRVDVTDQLTCSRAFVSDGGDVTLYFKDVAFTGYIPYQYIGDPENPNDIWNKADRFVGKKFTISGTYSWHRTSSGKVVYQIVPTKSSDFVCENDHGTLPRDLLTIGEANAIAASLETGKTTDITYFTKGKIKTAPILDKKTVDNVEVDVVTTTITDGEHDIKLYKQEFDPSVNLDNLVVGSTVFTRGRIQNYNGTAELIDGLISEVYPHGTLLEDTFTVSEAVAAINALPSSGSNNENHPTVRYYITGQIKSIDSEFSSSRFDLTITDGVNELVIKQSRIRSGMTFDDFAVGSNIVVSGRLFHDGDEIKLEGSCYIEKLIA